ncbi:MAG TPA: hypothetical protein DCE44_14920, partial [Verrucomicrobiales bacterium]|nr:hypothetical protein [Verrucomicrobiales bacterium]
GTSAKSGIYSLRNRPAGAGYELVAHDEFVWNSLVPDVDLATDGSIFFADWHEGWPKSNKGRLYRASFPEVIADPVVKETAKLLAEGMTKRSEAELLALLSHRDMRVRQEAQFELAARGSKQALVNHALNTKETLPRLHALWALDILQRKSLVNYDDLEKLRSLLNDRDDEVRAQTVRLMGNWRLVALRGHLPSLVNDASPRVRAAAIKATGQVTLSWGGSNQGLQAIRRNVEQKLQDTVGVPSTDTRLYEPLFEAPISALKANSGRDLLIQHAAVSGLEAMLRLSKFDTSVADRYATNNSNLVRLVGLVAARRMENDWVARFLSDSDPLLVLEAARAINDVPITNALPALAECAQSAKLDALLKQFAAISVVGQAPTPVTVRQAPTPAEVAGGGARATTTTAAGTAVPILDVRADQPLPWTNAPIDQLTPMLLRVVNANFRVGTPESAQRLAAVATRTDLSDLIRSEALHGLATWANPHPRDRIVGTYRPLPARDPAPARDALAAVLTNLLAFQPPPPLTAEQQEKIRQMMAADPDFRPLDTRWTTSVPEPVLLEASRSLAQLKPPGCVDALFRVVASRAPAGARAGALRSLAEVVTTNFTSPVQLRLRENRYEVENPAGDPAVAEAYWKLGTALSLASRDQNEVLRLAASKLGAELNPGDAAGQLASKLSSSSVAEQQSAYVSLGDLKSDSADALLAEALDKLMKREIANEVMLDLVEAAAKRNSPAVKTRLAEYEGWKLPKDHLSPYREVLFGGDAARGKKIFYENAAVACTRCHQISGDGGGNAGPKLDGLASRATREHLLESVVFPNQQVTEGFETAIVTLKNGQSYAGVVRTETPDTVVIISPEEGDVTLKKNEIVSREKGLSGMPDGFGQLLTRQELRDVVEFLGSLK